MKKNGYFTPNKDYRKNQLEVRLYINKIKRNLNLKPKKRYRLITKLVEKELISQIRNSIKY